MKTQLQFTYMNVRTVLNITLSDLEANFLSVIIFMVSRHTFPFYKMYQKMAVAIKKSVIPLLLSKMG